MNPELAWPTSFFDLAAMIAYGLLILAMIVTVIRLVLGPTTPDRILALDLLTTIGMGFIAVTAIETARYAYLDVGIALGLVAFLATIAFARYTFRASLKKGEARDID